VFSLTFFVVLSYFGGPISGKSPIWSPKSYPLWRENLECYHPTSGFVIFLPFFSLFLKGSVMKIVLKCQIVPSPGVSSDEFGDILTLPDKTNAAIRVTLDKDVSSFFLHSGAAFIHLHPDVREEIFDTAQTKVKTGQNDAPWEFPVEMSLVQIEYLYYNLKRVRDILG
jgi:hypothetical protein